MIRPGQGFSDGQANGARAADADTLELGARIDPGAMPLPGPGSSGESTAERAAPVRLLEPPPLPGKEPEAPAEPSPSRASGSFSRTAWVALAVLAVGMVIGGFIYARRGSPAEAEGGRTAYVNAFGLNVRAGPGREHAILASLLRGDPVRMLDERDARDPRWVRVRVAEVEGWVNSDYLADSIIPGLPPAVPSAGVAPVQTRITLQYQVPGDRASVDAVQQALRGRADWRVGEPERVLPAAENRAEVYGGLRFYFESDLELARAVCAEVVAELARRGMTVTMPLWPMVTGQREGRFNASPGLIEVWISPLPAASPAPAPMGRCGR